MKGAGCDVGGCRRLPVEGVALPVPFTAMHVGLSPLIDGQGNVFRRDFLEGPCLGPSSVPVDGGDAVAVGFLQGKWSYDVKVNVLKRTRGLKDFRVGGLTCILILGRWQ